MFYAGQKDVKDVFYALKDGAAELSESNDTLKYQACFFFIIIFCAKDFPFVFLGVIKRHGDR